MSTDRLAASGSTADTRRIWVVDDDRSVRFVLAAALREAGFAVTAFAAAGEALEALGREAPPALVVTDVRMPGDSGLQLLDKLKAKNLVGLAYWELGFRNVTNSKKPITKAEDLAGLKIRVIQSPIYIDMFNALGANAVPMPFPELYTALEQKAVDGQENPVTTILSSKFNEVQKHLAITRHMYNPQAVIVSKKFWDGLSPAEQKWINDAMAEATTFQRGVSRVQSDVALDQLKKSGMQVTEFPAAELDKLRAKMKPVIEKHSEKVGADTVKEVYDTLAKLRAAK